MGHSAVFFPNQRGLTPLVILSIIGLGLFLILSATVGFNKGVFQSLYPKPASQAAPAQTNSNRITYQGRDWFIAGVNVPWFNWGCDFGCNQNGGVMGTKTQLGQGFQQLKDRNVHMVRWWLFPGDHWQINRDGSGMPTGINPAVYNDIDAALELAEQYDLYYNFVIFNAANSMPASWLENPTHRQALVNALGPMFARYRNNPRVMTWEIYNEPEWQIWNGLANEQAAVATARMIADSVHANSDALVTIGQATIDGIPMWNTVNLDYHSPHWYDSINSGGGCAICRDYNSIRQQYGTNKPVVIGEFYANTATKWNHWYSAGYAGAWGWSLFWDHTGDQLQVDMNILGNFVQGKTDIGPRGSTTPTPTPAANTYGGQLRSSQEVQTPPVNSQATGTGTVVLNESAGTAVVSLSFSGLTSTQTMAHIHGPAPIGQNNGVIFTLPNGNFTNHQISLTATQIQQLKSGQYYFNVHTNTYPNGEIRGQILSPGSTPIPTPTPVVTPTPTPVAYVGPTVTFSGSCLNPADPASFTVSWTNPTTPVSYVDASRDVTFPNDLFFNKAVSGVTAITGPDGFTNYPSRNQSLTIIPNTPYYFRLWNGTHSPITAVTSPSLCGNPSPSATPTTLQGDLDGNHAVNIFDYNIVVRDFGKTGTNIQGDADKNGSVGIFDYNIVVRDFGKTM